MSVNVSSSFDLSPSLLYFYGMHCLLIKPSSVIYTSFYIIKSLLFLPLSIFILYLGLQRWRRQSSASTATTTTSHSDIFTYHLVAMEMICVFGIVLCCCGIYGKHTVVFVAGFFLSYISWFGETFCHLLTCVERYLAVVHPITYLSLRGERGIRLRNISVGGVWLFSIGGPGVMILTGFIFTQVYLCILIFSLLVISFCSLSALCALIRPGPGEQGGNRKKVDQSKRRAFFTIVAILGVLLLRFVWNLCWTFVKHKGSSECVVMMFEMWVNLPTSLMLPLLFLHRAGTFACCKKGGGLDLMCNE